ncbi:MAG TPA: hypothetical protein VMI54_18930 [Polyangiaceae bacterium]|nr:hypothetical protein [Polyangiaceae bacterium]
MLGALTACFVLCFAACSGPRFRSGATGAGGGGNAGAGAASGSGGHGNTGGGGLSPSAGAAGRSGTSGGAAGGAGRASSGGAAGKGGSNEAGAAGASDGCQCGASQYCRAGTCLDCADLSQLDFGDTQQILEHPSGSLRFPREGSAEGTLFFTLVTPTVSELWYAPDVATAPGSVIGASMALRASLDFFGDPGSLGFDVLFDETESDGTRSIRAATWQSDVLGDAKDAPAPLAPSGADDYGAAFVRSSSRVYFMTARGGTTRLVTGTLGTAAIDDVPLKIPGSGGAACALGATDATPWVTPDGRLLLVSAPPLDANCQPVDAANADLFVALMNPATGVPLATAVALVPALGTSEVDPSFSADLCSLYFASDASAANDGRMRLFRAFRR